jgi:hypothetical protein
MMMMIINTRSPPPTYTANSVRSGAASAEAAGAVNLSMRRWGIVICQVNQHRTVG